MRPERDAAVVAGRDGVLVPRLRVARSFGARLAGLLGRAGLAEEEGLLLERCGIVHTCFMRFPIDAVFLDGARRVLRVAHALRPWRVAGAAGARSVLELPAGRAARLGIGPGDVLRIGPDASVAEGGGRP